MGSSGQEDEVHRIKSLVVVALSCGMLLSACASGWSDRSEIVLTTEAVEETAEPQSAETEETAAETAAPPAQEVKEIKEPERIVIHVCGAVNREGVYTLDAGSRVYEAVSAAGGFAQDADEAYINQAEILADGVRLRIPTKAETEAAAQTAAESQPPVPEVLSGGKDAPKAAAGSGGADGKININTADKETLCRLSGIGESTAAKIIAWRDANGAFSRIEDIMQVSGIKEKLFAKIKDDITV